MATPLTLDEKIDLILKKIERIEKAQAPAKKVELDQRLVNKAKHRIRQSI